MNYKEIAWAYASSPNAVELGFADSGCYHISVTSVAIEGAIPKTDMPRGANGYERKDDPRLVKEFKECPGSGNPPWAQK